MSFKINKRILLISAVLIILFVIPASFASEMTNETELTDNGVVIDENTIYVSNGDNQGDGSQENPYNSISTAVEQYNSSQNSNVYIKNGDYSVSSQINLNKDITIIGESKEGTKLDAGSQNSIFKISSDAKVTLINLTLKNAKSSAVFLDSYTYSNVNVDNCIFENNDGGAIYYKATWTTNPTAIDIKNSVFKNNYNTNGGAIYIYGGTLLNVTGSVFEGNRGPTGETDVSDGGAIYGAGNVKDIYIDSCRFVNNTAIRGSAISQYCGGNLYISNSYFTNNTSPGNARYNVNSSLIYDKQSNSNELILSLNQNTIENNLNNEIAAEGNVKVEYLDKNTKLTANNVDKIYGDDYNYEVVLTTFEGQALAGKVITVTLTNNYDGASTVITNMTNSNGKAVFSLKTQKAGKYTASAVFEGEGELDSATTVNNVFIRTENSYNIIFNPDYIHLTEGDSYVVNGTICDEYLVPSNDLNGQSLALDWIDNNGKHIYLDVKSVKVQGSKLNYDINRCHLVTYEIPYVINFTVSSYSASITVDLSRDYSNIDPDLDTYYVSKSGNDDTGDGSQSNPLATIQMALGANYNFGGGKTIIVDEGTYEISTFTVLGNVTIIGKKSKTILKQTAGVLGMLEIDSGNTVRLIDLTFIDGYATPEPEALIHVCDDSVVYIEGCEFANNTAISGGAIAVSTGGSAYIDNSYFHNNKAYLDRIGGAIYVDRGYLYVANSLFENNTAGEGGAIFLGFPSEATIINSTFINNTATGTSSVPGSGGAIFTRSSNLLIDNSTFIENSAYYGGAIYIDYGAIYVYKSYFENNIVKYTGTEKGSAIQGPVTSYCNITMHYSILISDVDSSYLVYIPNLDENHTADVNDNLWKTNGLTSNTGFADQVKMVISTDSEFIYTGDVIEFTVEFYSSNVNGTSPLNDSVHDFDVKLIPKLGNIEDDIVVIKDNKAIFVYEATTVGEETIQAGNIFKFADYKFDVQDGSDKIKINTTISVQTGKKSVITVDFDVNLDANVTIRVNDKSYSVKVNNSKATLEIDTLPGNYTVKVVYPGDSTYKGFVDTETFEVPKFASVLTAENVTVYYNGNFIAILKDIGGKPISNEKILIKINNTEYTAFTDENGIATLELNLPAVGKYDVTSTFMGNSNYNSSEVKSTITVECANIVITPQSSIITPIKGSYSVNITDNKGKALKNVKVVFTFNNKNYNATTDKNGVATLDLSNNGLDADVYDITIAVAETAVSSGQTLNSQLTISKAIALINVEDITVYANSGKLQVTLTDEDGNPINGTNLTVKIGNNPADTITTNESGIATLDLALSVGNYTVTTKIANDKVYTANDFVSKISVKENSVQIIAPDVTVYYANGKFSAILQDIDGNAISNARLIVNINNNDYLATTDSNGVATININLPIGTYIALTKFEGNEIFQAKNITSTVNVVSSISSHDMVRAYNSPYDFQVILRDENGNPVENQNVSLIVNGKEYIVKTDSNGILSFANKLPVGRYAITVSNPVTGEKTSNYATIVARLAENKDIVMLYTAGNYYKVRVYGDDGKVAGNGEVVIITIDGKSYPIKTNAEGYAVFKINLKPKLYTITASYKGTTVKNSVKVNSIIKASNKKVKKSKKVTKVKITLKKVNGKVLKAKKLKIKFKGKKYNVKTNKKGVATWKVKKSMLKKLKVGKKYKYTVTYGKDTVTKKLTIKK